MRVAIATKKFFNLIVPKLLDYNDMIQCFCDSEQCFLNSSLYAYYPFINMFVCAHRYVMDEFGSALRHSDKPNFRVSPFLYMPEGNLASAVRFSS